MARSDRETAPHIGKVKEERLQKAAERQPQRLSGDQSTQFQHPEPPQEDIRADGEEEEERVVRVPGGQKSRPPQPRTAQLPSLAEGQEAYSSSMLIEAVALRDLASSSVRRLSSPNRAAAAFSFSPYVRYLAQKFEEPNKRFRVHWTNNSRIKAVE